MVDSMGLPCSHVIQQMGIQPLLQTLVNSFWWVSGGNNGSPIVHVPPNDISATLTALNIQFQEGSGPHQNLVHEQLERIQFTLSQPIAPPVGQVTRGRPAGALNSTRREPSAFEVELALPGGAAPRNQRRFSRCNVIGSGHNAATCPLK